MKKSYISNIMSIVMVIVLLMSFTFAWITDEEVQYGRWLNLEYPEGQLNIMANELGVELFIRVRDDTVPNDDANYDNYTDILNKPIFTVDDFAPGDFLQYRLEITTYSKIKTVLQVVFGGIETDSGELAEKLIFGTTKFTGFWSGEALPAHVVTSIAEKQKGTSFTFFERIELPAVQSTPRLFSIYWYVFFDRSGTNESATKYFKIPHLYIISI